MYRKILSSVAVVAGLAIAQPVAAAPLLLNGGFELGLSGWTTADATGSDGSFLLQSGTASPVNGLPVPPPSGGSNAAMTDAQGPGAHVLFQDFLVPATISSATLMFDLFVGNYHTGFVTPNTLAFDTTALNQQARVDILRGGTDPFSLSASDLLLNVFRTNIGDSFGPAYTTQSSDIAALLSANAGSVLRLRFAETDNVNIFNFGVDNVSLAVNENGAAVPEPATLLLLGFGLTAARAARRRTM